MNNTSYDRKIAQKLKKIDKAYVEDEDSKELVGGNVRELVDIKDGMGLQGMGLSAGMKKMIKKETKKETKKGKGMSAGAQLGYVPPVWKDNITPPFFVATGGAYSGEGMSAGGLLDVLKLPLKIMGFGKNGKKIEMKGAGLMDIFDPIKLIKFGRKLITGSGMSAGGMSAGGFMDLLKLPLKIMGFGKNGEEYEMEGCGAIVDTIKKLLLKMHPLMVMKGIAEKSYKDEKAKLDKQKKEFSGGAINRTGNQGLMGYGMEPKDGAGLMSVLSDIASLPSRLDPFTFSSPLDDLVGKERVRDVSKSIVEGMMDGKGNAKHFVETKGSGMKGRPTKQNMHSSSFSGGAKKIKKVNKRAEVVRKVMKERGVSMIEASKIVKNEGLY